jgi:hypothetical protein
MKVIGESFAEEYFVQQDDVLVEVFFGIVGDPLLEVSEVILGGRDYLIAPLQPFSVILEVQFDFILIKDTIDHVAAEQPKLDFIFEVAIHLLVLVHFLKYVRGCRPIT